jgi:hypothetical protein
MYLSPYIPDINTPGFQQTFAHEIADFIWRDDHRWKESFGKFIGRWALFL